MTIPHSLSQESYVLCLMPYDWFLCCAGVAVLSMNNKPANLLTLEYLTELNNSLDKLHADKSCRGLVITSVSTASVV